VKDFEVTIPGFATEGSATVMTDAPGSNVALSVNSHVLVAVTVYGMKKASMPDSVIGYTTHATLTVECPPKKDRVIYLQGSGGFDQLPSTVKLRKGEDSVDIYYRVALDASGPLQLTLSSEHLGSRTCSGKVLLGKVKSVFLTRTVRGGSTDELSLSVELLDPTRTDIEFPLASSDPSTVAVPPTLIFSTDARTAKISLKHFAVKTDKDVGITLLVGDLKFNKTVTVTQ